MVAYSNREKTMTIQYRRVFLITTLLTYAVSVITNCSAHPSASVIISHINAKYSSVHSIQQTWVMESSISTETMKSFSTFRMNIHCSDIKQGVNERMMFTMKADDSGSPGSNSSNKTKTSIEFINNGKYAYFYIPGRN